MIMDVYVAGEGRKERSNWV